jgi:hypothetical protein
MLATVANAKNNDANLVASKLGINTKEFNPKASFFGKNKAAFDTILVNYLSGKSDAKEVAKYLKALNYLKTTITTQLTVQFSAEAYELSKKIDALIVRMTAANRVKKAYRTLVYNGDVCKLEKREFRKIAVKAILKHNVQAAA